LSQTVKLRRSATSGSVPTTSALALGELAINTYDGKLYLKKNVSGTETIVEIGANNLADTFHIYEYSVTANTTVFQGSDDNSHSLSYTTGSPPRIAVYLNGLLLDWGTDFTATNGSSVTLSTAAVSGDLVQIQAYKSTVVAGSNLMFADDIKAQFGDDGDLEIFHDGTRSIINDVGTGNLQFQIGGTAIYDVTTDGIVLANGLDVEASEFIGDLRGAVLFKAQAGEALSKGDAVYISGINGNTTIVSKADANDANKMPAFGVAAAAITGGTTGDIYTFGTLTGLNTSGFSLGDELYVSTTAGALTNSAPTGSSSQIQKIAKVTRSDNSAGSIKIMGAGRSNATPNLDEGKIFVGNASNQSVQGDDTLHVDMANSRVGINTSSPTHALQVAGDIRIDVGNALKLYNSAGNGWAQIAYNNSLDHIEVQRSFQSATDSYYSLGSSAKRWLNTYSDNFVGDTLSIGNITATGYLRGPATFTIDPAAHGDDTGTLVIAGNLQVDGTTTTINSTTLTVDDKNITLASGSANAAAANGAGLTVDGASATLTYTSAEDRWNFNKKLYVPDNIRIAAGAPSLILQDTTDDDDHSIRFMDNGGTNRMSITTGGDNLNFETTGSRDFTFMGDTSGSGNVGIGTTTPSHLLELSNTMASSPKHIFYKMTGTNVAGGGAGIKFDSSATNNDASLYWSGIQGIRTTSNDGSNELRFWTTSAAEAPGGTQGAPSQRMVISETGNVGIGTTTPTSKVHISGTSDGSGSGADAMLHVKQNGGWNGNEPWALYVEGYSYLNGFRINAEDGIRGLYKTTSGGSLGFATSDTAPITFTQSASAEKMRVHSNGFVGIGNTTPQARLSVEEYGIDTTETSTSATTQTVIHTMSATVFRSARFTIQVTNSTDSTYHTTEILMVHDGTNANITEFGKVFTANEEATFDADVSAGNVRLFATPATTDSMEFKVVCHSITV
jgi:hypothetical protein